MPTTPTNFEAPLPTFRFREVLNAHPRDSRLRFFESDHKYTWDGQPTLGSVTGLIHQFAQPFIENEVIQQMRQGPFWPGVGYMSLPAPTNIVEAIASSQMAGRLASLLSTSDADEHAIATEAQRLRHIAP